jgi:hypothetical protein
MHGFALAALATSLLLVWPPTEAAADVCVNPLGTDGCFASLQAAVDAVTNGGVVDVAAGTYVGAVDVGPGRSLTIAGAGSSATIVQGSGTLVTVRGMDTTVTLRGLGFEGSTLEHSLVRAVNAPVTLIVEDCRLTGDHTMAGTAALSGVAVVRRTLIESAQTGLVIGNGAVVEDSIFRGNGFGIRVGGGGRGRFRIARTEISDGAASGIVIHAGKARGTIVDSTISGNAAPGVYVVDRTKLTVERTTIAGNGITQPSCCGTPVPPTSGGIWVSDGKVGVTVRASILANDGLDCAARDPALNVRMRSTGFNVVRNGPCGKAKPSDASADPLLAALADDGSGTRTHALVPGSPALGRVTKTALCKGADQRGVARSFPCDSGAYEAP